MARYSDQDLKYMAIHVLNARDNWDPRWQKLESRIMARLQIQPSSMAVQISIEKLAKIGEKSV